MSPASLNSPPSYARARSRSRTPLTWPPQVHRPCPRSPCARLIVPTPLTQAGATPTSARAGALTTTLRTRGRRSGAPARPPLLVCMRPPLHVRSLSLPLNPIHPPVSSCLQHVGPALRGLRRVQDDAGVQAQVQQPGQGGRELGGPLRVAARQELPRCAVPSGERPRSTRRISCA